MQAICPYLAPAVRLIDTFALGPMSIEEFVLVQTHKRTFPGVRPRPAFRRDALYWNR